MVAFESVSLFSSVAIACSSHLFQQNLGGKMPAYIIFDRNHSLI